MLFSSQALWNVAGIVGVAATLVAIRAIAKGAVNWYVNRLIQHIADKDSFTLDDLLLAGFKRSQVCSALMKLHYANMLTSKPRPGLPPEVVAELNIREFGVDTMHLYSMRYLEPPFGGRRLRYRTPRFRKEPGDGSPA